ncbi:MAG: hypothetical protein LQ351_001969 [Letrouitia transgressa]|nr:MAG: hypothetical protein LQ351_001969 [Letrouitia transgressa]
MTTPLVTATLQAAFLSLCSSAVATFLSPKRPPVFALFIFSILSTPPNYLWQQYIEKELPGYAIKKVESDLNFLGGTPGGKGITIKRRLNVRNTLVKVGLDQTIGALVNTSAYVGAVQLLRGVPPGLCWQAVKEQTWPLMIAGYKVWPLVSLLNFTVVPVEKRVVVGSLVGLGWGVFLALKAAV